MKMQNHRTAILMFGALAVAFTVVHAQNAPAPAVTNAVPADTKDVDSIEHIIGAVYDCISGPPGPRNWDRFRSLYYPGARLIPSFRDANGAIAARSSTVDEYAERAAARFAKEGFYESPIANRIETWDHIAHVWSTYESRRAKGDKPFARGINSFQLIYDGTRWWILTVYWEAEDAGHPLSDKYLK